MIDEPWQERPDVQRQAVEAARAERARHAEMVRRYDAAGIPLLDDAEAPAPRVGIDRAIADAHRFLAGQPVPARDLIDRLLAIVVGVYGDAPRYWAPLRGSGACPDCGVQPGEMHTRMCGVQVTPRTADGRKSSVWAADFYEVAAYYVTSDPALLGPLEDALKAIPGVYRTTRVVPSDDPGLSRRHNVIRDPDWPVGSTRRDKMLRVQVLALLRDPGVTR